MPFVKIEVTREGVTREQKHQLIKGVTDVITNVLNKDPFLTHISIQEVETDNWGHAGEFGKDNIRVNTIGPGTIRTPMHGDNADQTAGLHLLNRVGEVEDIAEMVYAVAKSNFITGAIINVYGGMGAGRNFN